MENLGIDISIGIQIVKRYFAENLEIATEILQRATLRKACKKALWWSLFLTKLQ